MSKANRYISKVEGDGIDELSKKLTADLRKTIRSFACHEVLSPKWREMALAFERIAHISSQEQRLPKSEDGATLWECEELALRYILADGKLNLCMRLLFEYRNYCRDNRDKFEEMPVMDKEVLLKFERGLGVVLKNAWMHAEALQTSDIPALMKYIGEELKDFISEPLSLARYPVFKDHQPYLVLEYLKAVGDCIESLDERRVMGFVVSQKIIPNAFHYIQGHLEKFSKEEILRICEGISKFLDTETFCDDRDMIMTPESIKDCAAFGESAFITDVKSDFDVRPRIRPVLDLISFCKRSL